MPNWYSFYVFMNAFHLSNHSFLATTQVLQHIQLDLDRVTNYYAVHFSSTCS